MKNKISKNYEEEISFGIVEGKNFEGDFSRFYTIFHLKQAHLKGIEKEVLLKEKDYSSFTGYLKGACFGKLDVELVLYNGFSKKIKDNFYPNEIVSSFDDSKLKDLVECADLPKHIIIKNVK